MVTTSLGKVTIVNKGTYSSTENYDRLDVVTLNGSSYICNTDDTTGVSPDTENNVKWTLLAAKGDTPVITFSDDGYFIVDGVKTTTVATGNLGTIQNNIGNLKIKSTTLTSENDEVTFTYTNACILYVYISGTSAKKGEYLLDHTGGVITLQNNDSCTVTCDTSKNVTVTLSGTTSMTMFAIIS